MAARQRSSGLTLVELLVGVIAAGIVAAVVIPQFTAHRGEARLALLDAQLARVRAAVELYAYQHGGTYPGARDPRDPSRASAHPDADFLQQLTAYSDAAGGIAPVRDAAHPFGPYLPDGTLPQNPFTSTNTVAVAAGDGALPPAADGVSAWGFVPQSGRFFANQAGHESR